MTPTLYHQCRIRRERAEQVSYLPQKFAVVGRVLRLRQDDGSWEDGWRVENVYGEPVPEHRLPDVHDAVKLHRRATGDAATRAKG